MASRKAPSLKRRIAYRAGGCILSCASWLARIFPERAVDRVGIWLGRLAIRVSKKHRERTESNLRMCYPEWSDEEIRNMTRRVFEHFGKTAMRFLRASRMSDEEVLRSVEAPGIEILDAALAEGKGVLLISAHFGNWERGAHFLATKGYKISVVARDANDAKATEVVNRKRSQQGVEVFSRGSAAKEILSRLKRNEIVAILPDQNTWEIYVPFFGKPAGTAVGPAVFHLRTGAPIIGSFCIELADGTYKGVFQRLELPELSGDKEEDVRRIMTAINAMIENVVRAQPEQWLWMHDRWKAARNAGLIEQ